MKLALLTLTLLLVAAAAFLWSCAPRTGAAKVPDRVEAHGPFEIVTHTTTSLRGWNEGSLSRGTSEHYSLRHRGTPVTIEGKAGMWGDQTMSYTELNSVVTFPSAEPVVVVNVGDPNNSSFYYLVREREGAPVAEHLGSGSGGVAVDWLDAAATYSGPSSLFICC